MKKKSSTTAAPAQTKNSLPAFCKALSAFLALTALRSRKQDDAPKEIQDHLRRVIAFVQGYFSALGVKFNEQGEPSLVATPLDTSERDGVMLPARAYSEASRAIHAALGADPGEQDFDLNPARRVDQQLTLVALKLGAYRDIKIKDPSSGEMVPVVARTYFYDKQTGQNTGWQIDRGQG